MKDKTPATGGRFVAWAGFLFGSVISTAGNVLYTWIPPANAAPGWTPTLTAQAFAAVWPLALLLSVEVLSRVQWAAGWQWVAARYGGAGTVAVGSGVISYGHLNGVLTEWQYGPLGAGVGPLVLDGLMVVSGFALMAATDTPGQADQTGSNTADRAVTVAAVVAASDEPNQRSVPVAAVRDRAPLQVVDQRYHPEPTGGPGETDRLLPELVQWSGEMTEPPSARAVRTRFGIGHDRAKRLLEQLAVAQ